MMRFLWSYPQHGLVESVLADHDDECQRGAGPRNRTVGDWDDRQIAAQGSAPFCLLGQIRDDENSRP